jgi:hypothetical protein
VKDPYQYSRVAYKLNIKILELLPQVRILINKFDDRLADEQECFIAEYNQKRKYKPTFKM